MIPDYVIKTIKKLQASGYEAYIVGGCVRDILMEKTPNDWDITTNARPEEILKVFPEAKYENNFGTVILPIRSKAVEAGATKADKGAGGTAKGSLEDVIEITTYRSEQGYSDRRHPDIVRFETELDKDLERRDFTINALALDPLADNKVIDLFGGRKDIAAKIIRAVGEPSDRFKEDALRMIRAIRFSAQLGNLLAEFESRGPLRDRIAEGNGHGMRDLLRNTEFQFLVIVAENTSPDHPDANRNHRHFHIVRKHDAVS